MPPSHPLDLTRAAITRLQARLRLVALVSATAVSVFWTAQARAENTVTLTITGARPLVAHVEDAALGSVAASREAQRDTGTLHLIVSDMRGTSNGWSVSLASSDFVYLGDAPDGRDIPSTGFRLQSAQVPIVLAGQERGEHGPYAAAVSGLSLETPRTVIWANPGGGSGDYEQVLGVELDIPAGSQEGVYAATLTVSFVSAP